MSGAATHVVVRVAVGLLVPRELVVPLSWARSVKPERIELAASRDELVGLPEFRPDDDIAIEVLRRLAEPATCGDVLATSPTGWQPTRDGMQLVSADGQPVIAFHRWSNSLFVSHRSSGVDVQLRRGGPGNIGQGLPG